MVWWTGMSEFRARKVLWNHLISAFLSGFGLPISGNTLHLSLSCFDMTMPLCTKPAPLGSFFQFGVEELNWTNLRPIQHVWNWNSDVIAQLQCWTTPMQLWLHWNKLLQPSSKIWWKAIRAEAFCYMNVWMPVVLDWSYSGVMLRCPHNIDHVYFIYWNWRLWDI